LIKKEKFDVVLMPRPNLDETFFTDALAVSKKETRIIYYGFSPESKRELMVEGLINEAKKLKRKIKVCLVFVN
jgi:tRNA G37 N-methylase Trm5